VAEWRRESHARLSHPGSIPGRASTVTDIVHLIIDHLLYQFYALALKGEPSQPGSASRTQESADHHIEQDWQMRARRECIPACDSAAIETPSAHVGIAVLTADIAAQHHLARPFPAL
jgi:hypothetical protein